MFMFFVFFPGVLPSESISNKESNPKPKSQPNPKPISPAKQTLAFKPINFLGKKTQKNPQKKQTKPSKSPPPNQRT